VRHESGHQKSGGTMNIAIFGWYHHQNAGDDRIQHCLTRWLDGHTLAFLPAGRSVPVELLRTYDAAIIGGGGLIHKRGALFRDMADWVHAAGIPGALVGVSVEAIDEALRAELHTFMDKAVFAWFRDQGSLDSVGTHPNAFVAPDVTWLYPYAPDPPKDPVTLEGIAVSLRAERGLDGDGWRQALARLGMPFKPWPFYFEGGGDQALLDNLFPDRPVANEFSTAPARAAQAVLAGRFHAAVFALQLGRPFIAVSSRPKMRRFLTEHGLGEWCVAEDRPQDFIALWPDFCAAQDRLAAKSHALASQLHREVWDKTTHARAQLLKAAAALPPPRRRRGLRKLFGQ
jgi:polysaccharide pyruvyl transferase WcaK-like protein